MSQPQEARGEWRAHADLFVIRRASSSQWTQSITGIRACRTGEPTPTLTECSTPASIVQQALDPRLAVSTRLAVGPFRAARFAPIAAAISRLEPSTAPFGTSDGSRTRRSVRPRTGWRLGIRSVAVSIDAKALSRGLSPAPASTHRSRSLRVDQDADTGGLTDNTGEMTLPPGVFKQARQRFRTSPRGPRRRSRSPRAHR